MRFAQRLDTRADIADGLLPCGRLELAARFTAWIGPVQGPVQAVGITMDLQEREAIVTRGATAGMARVRLQLYDLAVSIDFCLQRTVGLADEAGGVRTRVCVRFHPAKNGRAVVRERVCRSGCIRVGDGS